MTSIELQSPVTSVPSPERQAELEAAYERQKETDAPYRGVKIRTLGELQWIMQKRRWSGEYDVRMPDGLPEGMTRANFAYADFRTAQLAGASLIRAQLQGADFTQGHLEGAQLNSAHLEDTTFYRTHLNGMPSAVKRGRSPSQSLGLTDLRGAYLGSGTIFNSCIIGDRIRVADVRWNTANLSVIRWTELRITRLGDEVEARSTRTPEGTLKDPHQRARSWERAIRAYRSLVIALRAQGLYEQADQFAYRAQVCQRRFLRQQGIRGLLPCWGSVLLDLLAGYGYRPARTLLAYLLVIIGFTAAYMLVGSINGHAFTFHEGIIFSLTSFHGRGFFPGGLALDDPITTLAAVEAVIGLLIEVSFIATFTQRFFGR
jgi:hypothetical protein